MKKLSLIMLFCLCGSQISMAQTTTHALNVTVTPGAIIAVGNAATPFKITVDLPSTPGDEVVIGNTDNNTRLQYTLIQNSTANDGKITAQLDALIPRIRISVTRSAATAGTGVGVKGAVGAPINLSTSPQNVVTGIETCWTGTTAATDGPLMSYNASLMTGGSLTGLNASLNGAPSRTITYTISVD